MENASPEDVASESTDASSRTKRVPKPRQMPDGDVVFSKSPAARLIRDTSRYKGVSFEAKKRKWKVRIRRNGKFTHIAYMSDELRAAKLWDIVALQVHGLQAIDSLNFPERMKALLGLPESFDPTTQLKTPAALAAREKLEALSKANFHVDTMSFDDSDDDEDAAAATLLGINSGRAASVETDTSEAALAEEDLFESPLSSVVNGESKLSTHAHMDVTDAVLYRRAQEYFRRMKRLDLTSTTRPPPKPRNVLHLPGGRGCAGEVVLAQASDLEDDMREPAGKRPRSMVGAQRPAAVSTLLTAKSATAIKPVKPTPRPTVVGSKRSRPQYEVAVEPAAPAQFAVPPAMVPYLTTFSAFPGGAAAQDMLIHGWQNSQAAWLHNAMMMHGAMPAPYFTGMQGSPMLMSASADSRGIRDGTPHAHQMHASPTGQPSFFIPEGAQFVTGLSPYASRGSGADVPTAASLGRSFPMPSETSNPAWLTSTVIPPSMLPPYNAVFAAHK